MSIKSTQFATVIQNIRVYYHLGLLHSASEVHMYVHIDINNAFFVLAFTVYLNYALQKYSVVFCTRRCNYKNH